jgi:hypothetical protein
MIGIPAIVAALVISITAHLAVGAVKSLITLRSWWASGLEMTIVGVIEAAVTYGLGFGIRGDLVSKTQRTVAELRDGACFRASTVQAELKP